MAEGRGNRRGTNSRGTGSGSDRMDEDEIMGQDLTSEMDEPMTGRVGSMNSGMNNGMSGETSFSRMMGNTQDPIERVAQVYQFLRSPQVDQTIRRFVSSRKTRQLIAAGLSVLEIVVILLPLMKKLGGRVQDFAGLVKQPTTPQRSGRSTSGGSSASGTSSGSGRSGSARSGSGRASRALPASSSSVH
jgi:uncharacterized membrane protein YgcG